MFGIEDGRREGTWSGSEKRLEGLGGRKGKGESEVGSIEFGENIPCEKLEIGGVGLKGKRGRIKEENKRIEDGEMGVSLRRIFGDGIGGGIM